MIHRRRLTLSTVHSATALRTGAAIAASSAIAKESAVAEHLAIAAIRLVRTIYVSMLPIGFCDRRRENLLRLWFCQKIDFILTQNGLYTILYLRIVRIHTNAILEHAQVEFAFVPRVLREKR